MIKNIAIIGVGRFGNAVLDALIEQKNKNIFVVDKNEALLRNCLSNYDGKVTGVSFDSMQKIFLEENGIAEMDVVIVAISDITSSVITSINLIDLGVKKIIVKSIDNHHNRILQNIGIKNTVQAYNIAAQTISKRATLDVNVPFQVIDEKYISAKIKITNPDIDGESINSLKMYNNTSYHVSYILRKHELIIANDSTEIKLNDELYIIVEYKSLNSLLIKLTKNS